MNNINFNRLLFEMFWEQNAEKSFDDFCELEGTDKEYSGIKLKELGLKYENNYTDYVIISDPRDDRPLLCCFYFEKFKFDDFSSHTKELSLNILDHIAYTDLV